MPTDFSRFLSRLAILSGVIGVGLYCWTRFAPLHYTYAYSWLLLGFFVLVTGLIHYQLMRSAQGDPQRFVRTFMTLTSLKLFTFLIILTIYAFLARQNVVVFTIHFLIFYLIFTVFEVAALYKFLRHKK
jgi:hypothetical protein